MNKKKQPPAVKPEDITKKAHAIKRTPIEVSANQLRPAPWNPRPPITPESVADIAASIKSIGLIQPLIVMKDPDKPSFRGQDFYLLIAGHRRLAAWIAAGMKGNIRCEVVECDIETAKRMTTIENLQRKDVDPIMEADLIEGLVQGGMTIEEIAAETGRGEKWVWRRKQLGKLTDGWKELIGKHPGKFTIDCLEKIARYDEKVQDRVIDDCKNYWKFTSNANMEWSDVSGHFGSVSRSLKDAKFCTGDCERCTKNTATTPMLFDDPADKKGKILGTCTDKACFEKKNKEWFEAEKARLEKKFGKLTEVKSAYSIAVEYSEKKSKNLTVPIVENNEYSGSRIVWIKPISDQDMAAKAKRKEADAAAKKAAKLEKRTKKEIVASIAEWCKDHFKSEIRKALCPDDQGYVQGVEKMMLLIYLFDCGGFNGERWVLNEFAFAWINPPKTGIPHLPFDEIFDRHFDDIGNEWMNITQAAIIFKLFGDSIIRYRQFSEEEIGILRRELKSVVGWKPGDGVDSDEERQNQAEESEEDEDELLQEAEDL